MSFVLQSVTSRGLVLSQVDAGVLRIGRGTNAELRSDNPAVALDHATIELDPGGYVITDKGSITGTYVNGKPVERARLAQGDVIEIGDLRIEVQFADPSQPLFLRITSTLRRGAGGALIEEDEDDAAAAAETGGVMKAPRVDYGAAFRLRRPWMTNVSLIAIAAIVVLAVVAQITQPGKQAAFQPGGVSSAHARARDASGAPIATKCDACHTPWRGVADDKCQTCHARAPHNPLQASAPPCMSCHPEHRGAAKLAAISDTKCTGCHADLSAHVKPRVMLAKSLLHIRAFGAGHPEFVYPPDRDTLRFDHALHLRAGGIVNAGGVRETLQCATCHRTLDNGPRVSFAADCQRCHKLTFDIRFPSAEVPHGGDPGLVYGFVVATYAGNRNLVGKSPAEARRILAAEPQPSPDATAVINAEQVIKTKCALCHIIERRNGRLVATPPAINTTWLSHGRFSHARHRQLACTTCHDAARTSRATSDVLLPSQKVCATCHAALAENRIAASSCVTCHDYHERSTTLMTMLPTPRGGASGGGGGMLSNIILITIAILLIVVLLPVSLAIAHRIRANAAAPEKRTAPPPPPLPPPAPVREEVPTEVVDRSGRHDTPPAQPAAEPPKRSATIVQQRRPTMPGGTTELKSWYGILHCTSGALEGQHFVIEEEGLYIGRDPQLSQIVIPDGRVSKRHVRILPRDGRVHAIDEGSTNGTFLNSPKSERITDVELDRGDAIIVSDNVATFVYRI